MSKLQKYYGNIPVEIIDTENGPQAVTTGVYNSIRLWIQLTWLSITSRALGWFGYDVVPVFEVYAEDERYIEALYLIEEVMDNEPFTDMWYFIRDPSRSVLEVDVNSNTYGEKLKNILTDIPEADMIEILNTIRRVDGAY